MLQKKILQKKPEELEKELQKQITEKLTGFLSAIPMVSLELGRYRRKEEYIPVLWHDGSSCLYKYEGKNERITEKESTVLSKLYPLLIIPSLINRHYILDLEEGNSFVRYFSQKGIDTYLASWGEPLEEELDFSLEDYISRIGQMIDTIYKKTGKKIILTGYCMGGLLSLASAIGKTDKIHAIAFLATPWDFHSEDFPNFLLDKANLDKVNAVISGYRKIPASIMQALFYYMHANLVGHKFEMYSGIKSLGNSKGRFIAIENWVNDGISMTKNVAKECFISWVNNNNVAKLQWKNKGEVISPSDIAHLPAFFAIPQKDSIVPPSCALPLIDYFNDRKVIKPNTGHVGMVVGNYAKSQTWEPFLEWLHGLAVE